MLAPRRPLVLIVDDVEAIRASLSELLSGEGYDCWTAPTADAAYRLLQDATRAPDVILLDLWMPGMPARRFLSLLKERAAWARARVVLATAAVNEVPLLGVDAVVGKPFDVALLLTTLAAATGQLPSVST